MHELTFLQDIALVMIVSALVTIVCHQLRLPVVLGYIIAGLIVGPHTPPYSLITDLHNIQTLSELGVIFLLFGIGLEFSLTKLLKVGIVSFIAASLEIFLMLLIGFSLGRAFGWHVMDSLFLGAILCISSTTIIAKILMDTKKLQERFAQIILGILIIEDLLAIVIIAVLSGLAFTGEFQLTSVLMDLFRVGGFITGVLLVGIFLLPRALSYIHTFQSSEMTVIAVLGLLFGTSLLGAKLGFSVALGAFLVGAVIAETKQAKFIIRHFESIRNMFTAVFFVSVGMLLDPKIVIQYALPIVIITIVTILGKIISCSFATFLMGDKPTTALKVGLGLAQIGEFSFIIASLGESARVTSPFIFPIAVAVSSLTTLTTPFLMKYSDTITSLSARWMPKPIVTFAGLYSEWIKFFQIKRIEISRRSVLLQAIKEYMPKIFFYAVCLGALVLLPSWLINTLAVPYRISWIVTGIILSPFLFGFVSNFDKLGWQVFSVILSQKKEGAYQNEINDTLHNVLRFVMIMIFGLVLLSVTPFVVFPLTLTVIVIASIGLSSMVLWESMRKFHERVEVTVWGFFDREIIEEKSDEKAHDELVQTIQQKYPWGVETQDFIVPYGESGINQPIRELGIRTKTGATVVGIYRSDETILNPSADTVLLPGDVLLLMGSREQIQNGLKFLNEKIKS